MIEDHPEMHLDGVVLMRDHGGDGDAPAESGFDVAIRRAQRRFACKVESHTVALGLVRNPRRRRLEHNRPADRGGGGDRALRVADLDAPDGRDAVSGQ
jgi:hypothetical protein